MAPLHQCFVPTHDLSATLVALLTQLQLPMLDLPAQCDWAFLQQLGVTALTSTGPHCSRHCSSWQGVGCCQAQMQT